MKKILALFLAIGFFPGLLSGMDHPLALGFYEFQSGRTGKAMEAPPKSGMLEYFNEVEIPPELKTLSIDNQNRFLPIDELAEKYQAIDFKDSKKLFSEVKAFLLSKKNLKKFEPVLIEKPERYCENADRLIQLWKYNRVLMLIARLMGKKNSGLPAAALVKATIYSVTTLMEHTGDLTATNFNYAYTQMANSMDVLSNGLNDFYFSKKTAQSIFDVFDKVGESLPDIEYVEKNERSIIRKFAQSFTETFSDFLKKGNVSGEPIDSASREIMENEIKLAREAESRASELLNGFLTEEVFARFEKPFSEKIWEEKSRELMDMGAEVIDASRPDWNSDRIAKSWITKYVFDPRRMAKAFWSSRQRVEGAKTLVALIAYKAENNNKWPESLEALEKWFEKPLGKNLYSGKWLHFDPENKIIRCEGADGRPDDPKSSYGDDLWIHPIKFE